MRTIKQRAREVEDRMLGGARSEQEEIERVLTETVREIAEWVRKDTPFGRGTVTEAAADGIVERFLNPPTALSVVADAMCGPCSDLHKFRTVAGPEVIVKALRDAGMLREGTR